MIEAFGLKVFIYRGIIQVATHNVRATYAEFTADVVVYDIIFSVVDDPRDNISKSPVEEEDLLYRRIASFRSVLGNGLPTLPV